VDRERVNWPVVAVVTVAGLTALALGLWLSDWTAEAWSAVFIEIGVAIGLLSVLVFLERRVVRRVAESAARTETERVAADLRGRIERLEDLDAAQEEKRSEQRRLAKARADAIRSGDISPSTIGDLLVEAVRDRLVDADDFHVRTSNEPDCPVLYMLPFVDPERVIAVYLDFEPFQISTEPILLHGEPVPVPEKTDSTVMWVDEGAAEIGAELQSGLERRNEPPHGFGFGHSLEMLLRSIEVMRDARMASAGSPRRFDGSLRVLINDDWAYTSAGLEAVSKEVLFTIRGAAWIDGGRRWVGPYTHLSKEVRSQADASLAEALKWIEERETIRLLEPGTDPIDSLFRKHR
jgi:hypothetical protein